MKYLLVDAKNCLYRNNYTSNLSDASGNKVSGVFGMFKDVTATIKTINPDKVFIVWDKGQCNRKLKIYPEYKQSRRNKNSEEDKELLENLRFQTKKAKEMFNKLPVYQLELKDTEADDIIGFLCKNLKGEKIIYSNDSDFFQLINSDTSVFISTKKIMLDKNNINEHLGFDVSKYVMWKSLVGDNSDDIKGLHKVGDKTAQKIIEGDSKRKITPEEVEVLKRNKKIITLTSLLTNEDKKNIVDVYNKQKVKAIGTDQLRKVCAELGFKSIFYNMGGITDVYKPIARNFKV